MPRALRILTSEYPYHVTARCINKEWFQLPLSLVWRIFSDYLYLIRIIYGVEIHSFVLMRNHFHLIIKTPDANLSEVMNYFMREVSKEIGRFTGRINQIFGGPYHSSVIVRDTYYMHAYKYVYRNPVEAGISESVETYPYSTLHGLLGFSKLVIPVVLDDVLFSDMESTLAWLNTDYKADHKCQIKNALRKVKYSLPADPVHRHKSELENENS